MTAVTYYDQEHQKTKTIARADTFCLFQTIWRNSYETEWQRRKPRKGTYHLAKRIDLAKNSTHSLCSLVSYIDPTMNFDIVTIEQIRQRKETICKRCMQALEQ
jgi:hypothetical protein